MSHSNQLACIFHPTKLILIDDHVKFLKGLRGQLESSSYEVKTFLEPETALEYLKQYEHPNNVAKHINSVKTTGFGMQDYPESLDENNYRHAYTDLKCTDFHEKVFSRERFEEHAVVVIDQVMPGMEGLDICKQLRDRPYKFIMLTAEGGDALARAAFNDGLIDHFVKKSDRDFVEQLCGAIEKLQKDYFHEQSHTFMESLIKSPTCVLADKAYTEMLNNYIKENNIIEYYLLNETGGFLMMDANGTPHWLAVISENEIAEDYEFASGDDYHPYPKVLEGLKNREALLFRISEKQLEDAGPDGADGWLAYMHPAKKIQSGHGDFYYSFFTGEAELYFDNKDVFSYQQFLSENE